MLLSMISFATMSFWIQFFFNVITQQHMHSIDFEHEWQRIRSFRHLWSTHWCVHSWWWEQVHGNDDLLIQQHLMHDIMLLSLKTVVFSDVPYPLQKLDSMFCIEKSMHKTFLHKISKQHHAAQACTSLFKWIILHLNFSVWSTATCRFQVFNSRKHVAFFSHKN